MAMMAKIEAKEKRHVICCYTGSACPVCSGYHLRDNVQVERMENRFHHNGGRAYCFHRDDCGSSCGDYQFDEQLSGSSKNCYTNS